MYTKGDTMTDGERLRLDEIDFIEFVQSVLKMQSNPVKLYDYLDITCAMIGCDYLILSSVIPKILQQDRTILPFPNEKLVLLSHAGIPVRSILKELKMSQRTFYSRLNQPIPQITPRFSLRQTTEVVQFMCKLRMVIPERR